MLQQQKAQLFPGQARVFVQQAHLKEEEALLQVSWLSSGFHIWLLCAMVEISNSSGLKN